VTIITDIYEIIGESASSIIFRGKENGNSSSFFETKEKDILSHNLY
jgi:hypothetical protein